ncbi:MAG TPA: hypothetical protein VGO01_12410 [Bradyrhizobium sp.]|jgi:hypothetical protein|nr:hypothetical protein [Bradyrhizobium sp.]
MKTKSRATIAALASSVILLGAAVGANAQERRFFQAPKPGAATERVPDAPILECSGPIAKVIDVAFEDIKATSAVFGSSPGGGEGGQFDKTPVLSTKVELDKETCLNAHLSVMVGSGQLYARSRMALFQVTLTGASGSPRHMVGHYETPFGRPSPAVAIESERDVDMLAANFFQRVGDQKHDVPPGSYRVDVWWAGAPPGSAVPTGVIGAAFVLKLYLR